jgi:hypothetical protein
VPNEQPEHELKEMIMQSFRQIFLPYALMNLHDGWFLPVNRNYKPLGPKVRIKGLTAAKVEKIGLKDGVNFYYLYDDATQPQSSAANWQRYEAILERLMKLEVEQTDDGLRGLPAAGRRQSLGPCQANADA